MGNHKVLKVVAATAVAFGALANSASAQPWFGHVGVAVGFGAPLYPYYSPWYYPFSSSFYGYPGPFPYAYPVAYVPDSGVRIAMTPTTAAVYVDGYYAGTVENFNGTFQKLKLEPGSHEITIYQEGYRSRHEHVYVGPDSTTKITGALEKLAPGEPNDPVPVPTNPPPDNNNQPNYPPPPRGRPNGPPPQGRGGQPRSSTAGTISIRVQPDSAEILIDGEHWSGRTDDRLVVSVSPGRHVVEIKLTGYRTYSTEIDVRDGATVPLNVSLTPDK